MLGKTERKRAGTSRRTAVLGLWALAGALASGLPTRAADERAEIQAIQAAATALVQDFNAGQAPAVAGHFLPQGELTDEAGVVHRGRQALEDLFTRYFEKFPGAKLQLEIDSIRVVGESLALQDGTRTLTTPDGARAQVRFSSVLAKADGAWRIAATQEVYDLAAAPPSEQLAPLAWLVGEWVGEGTDSVVRLVFRWDENQNYLLGDFSSTRNGQPLTKSTQRIAWDPRASQIRSWLFDDDGGFAEGWWTEGDDGWVIRSSATSPDGGTGSATLTIAPQGKNRFLLLGTDRIIGGVAEEDFELTVSRAPPAAKAAVSHRGAPLPATQKSTPAPAPPPPSATKK